MTPLRDVEIGQRVARITGADVVVDHRLQPSDVEIDGGSVAALTRRTEPRLPDHADGGMIDATGLVVAPGFIDLQCNGGDGTDLGADVVDDGRAIERVATLLPRFGVTSFLPTIVTGERRARDAALATVRSWAAADRAEPVAEPIGLHLEGPMISTSHLGAHRREHVAALTDEEIDGWIADGGVALVTLAPEIDDGLRVIDRLAGAGIAVAAGHTAMDVDEFAAARRSGLGYVTHLFNAMAPFDHRRPGPVGAVLADDRVVAGLICDGVHVDPTAIALAWRCLGPHRTSLVSDAAAPLGCPPGSYRLATREVLLDETGVRTADGVLAGSSTAIDQGVRNLITFTGCDLLDALATVTTTPADLLQLTDRGRIRTGARADVALLDPTGTVVATIIGGRLAWKS